jgi:Domain of unknown function (DUF4349)
MISEMGRARLSRPAIRGRASRVLGTCSGLGLVAMLVLAGCGSASSGAASPLAPQSHAVSSGSGSTSNTTAGGSTSGSQNNGGPPYLVKSLQVSLQVKDTRATAGTILAWIVATDPKSTTMGQQYTDAGNGLFTITLQFLVQATLYPQVEQYLLNYPAAHGGKLLSLQETVQDVTNDYIDTHARIVNLQTERQRLLDLLSKASSLSDILTLDQQLTTVEGQLEQIEAHQQALASEVTFYNVTLTLQPAGLPAPATQSSGFNFGQTLHDAWNAALVFAGWLAVAAIWLAIFSIFMLPVLAVFLVVRTLRRRRIRRSPVVAPASAST